MSVITILNNKISSILISFANSAGAIVSAPSGDSFTAVSSAPASLAAEIHGTATSPVLVLTPLVQAGTGYVVTVSDTKGLTAATVLINIAPDATIPAQLIVNATVFSTVSQPIPTSPGP